MMFWRRWRWEKNDAYWASKLSNDNVVGEEAGFGEVDVATKFMWPAGAVLQATGCV